MNDPPIRIQILSFSQIQEFLNGCQNVISEGVIFGIVAAFDKSSSKSIGHKHRIKDSFGPAHVHFEEPKSQNE